MHEKILEKVMEREKKNYETLLKGLGLETGEGIEELYPKKNIDVAILLSQLGLIDQNPENSTIIDEFHDYVMLVGIDNGLGIGQKMILDSIRHEEQNYEDIMKINPEDIASSILTQRDIEEIMEDYENDE